MNISFIFKVKILMLIEWSYRSPDHIEPRMVHIF